MKTPYLPVWGNTAEFPGSGFPASWGEPPPLAYNTPEEPRHIRRRAEWIERHTAADDAAEARERSMDELYDQLNAAFMRELEPLPRP